MKAAKQPSKFFRGRHYYFASEGHYVYEKTATRRFFRYLFLGLFLIGLAVWIVIESYRGWNIFSF